MKRGIKVPSCGHWDLKSEDGVPGLHLEIEATKLDANIQNDGPASPAFLWIAAWWLRQIKGMALRSSVHVLGRPNVTPALRRSAYLLNEYQDLFGANFRVQIDPDLAWRWPVKPVFNVEQTDRVSEPTSSPGSEAWFEYSLCRSESAIAALNERLADEEKIGTIERQMPVGMFNGNVRGDEEHRWTPGGKSAIDAWALSTSKKVLHLFELKVEDNNSVGIIPEALYYASLLGRVRDGIGVFDKERSKGLLAAATHNPRIVCWLVAPDYHPLVVGAGIDGVRVSPIAALNEALRERRIQFRILPCVLEGHDLKRWAWEQAWPAVQD